MKTILVIYTNGKNITVDFANTNKIKKYCFRTENDIKVGDILKSPNYTSELMVTDVIDVDMKYYNALTGELSSTITSTACYPIKNLVIREETDGVVYATMKQV